MRWTLTKCLERCACLFACVPVVVIGSKAMEGNGASALDFDKVLGKVQDGCECAGL